MHPCLLPAGSGTGAPATFVALFQFATVMSAFDRLSSYERAVPSVPLSPGDVQFRVTEVMVTFVISRSAIAAGGVVSGGTGVPCS